VATQDPRSSRASNADHEAAMAERRGRRLSLNCRLFFFGEEDFEGEARILDLSTGGCQATSQTGVQVGTMLRLSLFLQDQQWPVRIDGAMVRWVNGNSFGLEFTEIRSAQRERIRAIIMNAKL
jgi:c-di-GMP-binding flagellar brake protein YcgR